MEEKWGFGKKIVATPDGWQWENGSWLILVTSPGPFYSPVIE